MLNTTENTISHESADQAVKAWCAEVRRLHGEVAKSISLPAEYELDADAVADMYFGDAVQEEKVSVPEWPLPAPDWCISTTYAFNLYPEVTIEHVGKSHTSRGFSANISETIGVLVADAKGPGSVVEAGTWYTSGPRLDDGDSELSTEEAFALASVIKSAAKELNKYRLLQVARDSDAESAIVLRMVDEARIQAGLTVGQLAEQSGVSEDVLREYLANAPEFTISDLLSVSRALNISVTTLFARARSEFEALSATLDARGAR
jgi:hypothetical protein